MITFGSYSYESNKENDDNLKSEFNCKLDLIWKIWNVQLQLVKQSI